MSYGKRFAVVAAVVLLYVTAIVVQSFRTVVVQGEKYRKAMGVLRVDSVSIPQVRGFIFADGGEMLAGSLPEYDVFLDFRSTTVPDKKGQMNIPLDTINKYFGPEGEGSKALAVIDPRRSARAWGDSVRTAYRKRRPHYLLLRAVSYMDYKRLRTMPYFNKSRYLNGLLRDERAHRYRPFGSTRMAAATIGAVYAKDVDALHPKGSGRGGIEEAYDSLLSGVPGFGVRQRIRRRQVEITSREPVNGANVYTTLNVEMQDILDRALAKRLIELKANAGWSAVMEVKTGKIKAIANLQRVGDSTVVEDYNHLTNDLIDPGSTFKTVSYMVMLNDGKVTPDMKVNTGNQPWNCHGKLIRDDHNVGEVTADEAIVQSSNIAVAKLTCAAYEKDQQAYLDGIERIGMMNDLDLRQDFPGAQAPRKRSLKEKTWSKVSLGQISYGYENRIPGLYMLNFYNAIANDGRLMRPYIVERVEKDGDVLYERKPEVVNKSICSKDVLSAVRHALRGVVERGTAHGKYEHGREVLPGAWSPRVAIAGKTGTAQRYANGNYNYSNGHYVSFIGYFPAEAPQYTCIVVIDRPHVAGRPGGGYMAGPVFRQFAEEVYALHCEVPIDQMAADSLHEKLPAIKRGAIGSLPQLLAGLKVQMPESAIGEAEYEPTGKGQMPRVTGMGASDALLVLERMGLSVGLTGCGTVVSQSIPPGTPVTAGTRVELALKSAARTTPPHP